MSYTEAYKPVLLTRDVMAAEIPSGIPVKLAQGKTVTITQSLGGSYTVITPVGSLARIEGEDGDALGFEKTVTPAETGAASGKPVADLAWEQMRTCYDPEIPVNIVDLGLVYGCDVTATETGGSKVAVKFTLTAPGCGMGETLRLDIERKLKKIPGVEEAQCEIVFEPAWNQEMMTDAAKLQLGLM